jgi:hypothetical protein
MNIRMLFVDRPQPVSMRPDIIFIRRLQTSRHHCPPRNLLFSLMDMPGSNIIKPIFQDKFGIVCLRHVLKGD